MTLNSLDNWINHHFFTWSFCGGCALYALFITALVFLL